MEPISDSEQSILKAIDKKTKKGHKRVKGNLVLFGALVLSCEQLLTIELPHGKTNNIHRQKQRHRSASQ